MTVSVEDMIRWAREHGDDSLDLSQTGITALPKALCELPSLRRLSIAGTRIGELPDWLDRLAGLEELNLSNTTPGVLRPLMHLVNLRVLDLSGMPLTVLPDFVIGRLVELQTLRVGRNPISTLPESVGLLTNLRFLDLQLTELRKLPDSLSRLSELIRLDLSGTPISEVPDVVRQLTGLRGLKMAATRVSTLPDWIDKLGESAWRTHGAGPRGHRHRGAAGEHRTTRQAQRPVSRAAQPHRAP